MTRRERKQRRPMIEFEIRGDFAQVQNSVIDANFDELKLWLQNELAAYNTMVVTEDSVPEAKGYRANIRKIAARIDDQRKAVKTAYMAPLKAFEDKCRELTELCDQAVNALDSQVKSFENARRERREAELRQVFEAEAGDLTEEKMLSWEQTFSSSWTNASVSREKALGELREKIARVRQDIEAIRGMESPFETALLNHYGNTHDLADSLRLNATLTARKNAQDEAQRARERQKATDAEVNVSSPTPETVREVKCPTRDKESSEERPELFELDFRVWVTKEQSAALRDFLVKSGISFGRVPKDY